MTQTAKALFEAGRLQEAIQAMNVEVRNNPRDAARRGFLGDLLCLAGNLERADLQFDTIGQQEPALAVGVALVRQLIRGEQARRQFFAEGRVPEMIGASSECLKLHIEATVLLRDGDAPGAASLLARAEEQRVRPSGVCDGRPFDDLRDIDDLTACFFEVLTSTGKYYVLPIERVDYVEFRAPERPCDLMWRRAEMSVRDGPEGEVFLPSIYVPPAGEVDDLARLGRSTSWVNAEDGPTRGVGQRSFLVGEDDIPIMRIGRIEFAPAAA